MDDAMRMRFVKALEAKGITKGNWTEASIAVIKPNGKPLGKTFLRDAITRGKGKDEYVQWVCAHYEISWDYVKFNKGPAAPIPVVEHPFPEGLGLSAVNTERLLGAVEGVCKMLGASQQRAARLAREVRAIAQGRELPD